MFTEPPCHCLLGQAPGALLLPGSNYLRISQPNQEAGLALARLLWLHPLRSRAGRPTGCEHDVSSASHSFQLTILTLVL
jgi:hypothetical protein